MFLYNYKRNLNNMNKLKVVVCSWIGRLNIVKIKVVSFAPPTDSVQSQSKSCIYFFD